MTLLPFVFLSDVVSMSATAWSGYDDTPPTASTWDANR